MDSQEIDQSKLDEIAEEFSAAVRQGEQPSIDSFVARYPDLSGPLRSLLGSIAIIEGLKQQTSSAPSTSKNEALQIEQLDDYTIVREIGRGGMGVVFEAIHRSLGRRVAVKVLAGGVLGDTKHLTRFQREARAAAQLRHSNIVPVFGVGQSGDHHYYVMDFIDGMTLREWMASAMGIQCRDVPTIDVASAYTREDLQFEIESTGSRAETRNPNSPFFPVSDTDDYFRWAAELVATICDALEYAHAQGVLHRDIKPANLLIDRQGEIWIADFGLAKLTEQHAMTMTGDIVGTPQYMPPESFEGTYDVKSEIYSVGLTFYELLTRRSAIEGKSPADVIRKATEGVSVSPRKLNPHVPRDLETIVLKSLAHDPRARYVTAGDLRDDLRRFLTDRPISARRTGILERTVRWSRREPTVAVLTFTTFSLLLALAAVSAVGFVRTKGALGAAESANREVEASLQQRTAALQSADEQRDRAENNLQVALRAFDQVMQNISDRGIEPDSEFLGEVTDATSPNVTPDDAKLLQSLLGFFDELAANNSEELLTESAVAARRAGDIYLRLGQLREADRAYSDALARYRRISTKQSDNLSLTLAQAEIMNELAVITSLRGQLGRSDQIFDLTLRLLKDSEVAMDSPQGRFEYARAHRLFASLGARTGLDGVATPTRRPVSRLPRGPIGSILQQRTDDELSAVAEAITVLDSLIERTPTEVRYRAELARAYRDKARVASRAKLRDESEAAVKQSIELFEQLLAENKNSEAIRYELALTLTSSEAFSFNQMLRAIQANELSTALLASSPNLPRYQALRAHTLETLALHQQRAGRLEPAEQNLLDAVGIYDSLTRDSPGLGLYETRRSRTLESIADLKLRNGDSKSAIEYLEQAIRRLQSATRRPDASPVGRMQLQRMKQKLSRIEDQ